VLCYSKINQIGFMVVAVGIGSKLAIDGAIAHAFTHVIYKGLLFMSMGAVMFRTGEVRASHLGGLYKSMPFTTGFCIIGAASISAFPLFSGFISKSIIITEAARHGHTLVWICLLFASAGVFHKAGIKVPFFAFFAKDSGLRPKEAPPHMLIAMAVSAVLCVFLGCNPQWLYSLLPNGAMGYHPYDGTHVITQLEILLFSALTFILLNLWGKYPKDIPSVNLDIDWLYRKIGRIFINFGSIFWNGLNTQAHSLLVAGLTEKVCVFAKGAQIHCAGALAFALRGFGYSGPLGPKNEQIMKRRVRSGIYPIGLTVLFVLFLILAFLFSSSST
jgi:multicomponent Na+:H+ antiporter subunit D